MFRVPKDVPADILCDNMTVTNNATIVESKPNKKHISLDGKLLCRFYE